MIVCHCYGITDHDLLLHAGGCPQDRRARIAGSIAGTGCGGCRPLLDEIIASLVAPRGETEHVEARPRPDPVQGIGRPGP